MRIAIIDMGSNTFNLLIRETADGSVMYSEKIPVRLAEGGITHGCITPEAIERAMQCLQKYRTACRKWKVEELYALGTSALRDAENKDALIKRAKDELGLYINVIEGNTEAALIYEGVKKALPIPEEPSLIMDIGGGSSEFVLCRDREAVWQHSFNIGSSRLLDTYTPSDPLLDDEYQAITDYLQTALQPLWEQTKAVKSPYLIGSSGSFETLAAIASLRFGNFAFSESDTHGTIPIKEYHAVSTYLITNNLQTRLHTPGLIAMRARNIVMACLLIDTVLKNIPVRRFLYSMYAMKEGAYHFIKTKQSPWQKSLL